MDNAEVVLMTGMVEDGRHPHRGRLGAEELIYSISRKVMSGHKPERIHATRRLLETHQ
jgi:hypothetical protein